MRRVAVPLAKSMILVVGGSSEGKEVGCLSTCEVSSSIFNPFTLFVNSMAKARRGTAIAQTEDRGVAVIGGCAQPGVHLNDMEVMKQQKEWNSVSLAMDAFSCAAYCQLGGLCLITGGYNGRECLSQVALINSSTHEVSKLKPLSTPLKNGAALALEDDSENTSVLLFGGFDGKRTLCTVFHYSLSEQSCSITSLMPSPLESHTVTQACPRFAYIIGGYNGISVSNIIFQFHIQNGTFVELEEKLLISRENHAAVLYTQNGIEYLVVMGGWNGEKALNNCEVFMVMDYEPYLVRVHNHKLKLDSPRNKLAAIVVEM